MVVDLAGGVVAQPGGMKSKDVEREEEEGDQEVVTMCNAGGIRHGGAAAMDFLQAVHLAELCSVAATDRDHCWWRYILS